MGQRLTAYARWGAMLIVLAVGSMACTRPAPSAATATSIPGITAPATALAATATAPSSVVATPTTGGPASSCASLPIRGFGKVWAEQADARALVGCPAQREVGTIFEAQRFERGLLVWQEYIDDPSPFPPRGTILVLFDDDGSVARLADRWSATMPEPTPAGVAPAGLVQPSGRLGLAWREGAGLQSRLGWAIEPVRKGSGAWQGFTLGELVWIPFQQGTALDVEDRWLYAVSNAPTGQAAGPQWLAYKDTFRG
ncbi:MAG TPA: hypothetical protein VI789_06980 [Dehalococcoidia bacterium]|nr:hypothetical protein [Dehalococcoidia bacterium]